MAPAATITAAPVAYCQRRATLRAVEVAANELVAVPANDGLVSASAKLLAESNRSAGSFSSAVESAAATLGGTLLRRLVTAATGSAMIFMMICCAEPPRWGGCPVSI